MMNNIEISHEKNPIELTSLNPFQNNSLIVFASLMRKYGVDPIYLGRASLIMLASLAEFPFSLYEDFVYGSRIQAVQLREDPVFIIGHWRSGTTHLHNIISQDPQWATPTHMHVFYPKTFFTFEYFKSLFARRLPANRGYDEVKVSLDVPEEEEEALVSYSFYSFYQAIIFPKFADEIFRRYALLENMQSNELSTWQRDYTWFLKKISLAFNYRPLLLKNPVNTCRIEVLTRLFPQARFVHIHRNPFEVFESNIKMIQIYTRGMRLQKMVPMEELRNGILRRYQLMMEAYDRQAALLPSDKLVEVSFEKLRDNPVEVLNHVYNQLNLPGYNDALPYFEQYIDSQKSYRQNTYNYTQEDLYSVQEAWGKWIERWEYQLPCM